MLIIEDVNKLRVTKVTLYSVYFKYEDRLFFVKGSEDDYEYSYSLYERVRLSENKFSVEKLSGVSSGGTCVSSLLRLKNGIKPNPNKLKCNHNQFDMHAFALKLIHLKLVSGSSRLVKDLNDVLKEVEDNNKHINNLNAIISELRRKNFELLKF